MDKRRKKNGRKKHDETRNEEKGKMMVKEREKNRSLLHNY